MRRISSVQFALAAMVAVVAYGSPARAQSQHTWIASNGTNNGVCGRANPCPSFAQAYTATIAGGEITCIDSSDFGLLTITHSITVDCTHGGNGFGASISGTAVTDVVILKGIDYDGLGNVTNPGPPTGFIDFSGAGVLQLEKLKINSLRGATFNGIYFHPSGLAKLQVADSFISSVGTGGLIAGIYIKPASGVEAKVTIERTRIENNFFGIVADGTGGGSIRGVVRDSVVSGNTNNGITVSASTASVVLQIDNTSVSGNNFGLTAGGANAGMLVSHSSIVLNNTGLFTTGGGVLYSYGNNNVNGNSSGELFTSGVGQK